MSDTKENAKRQFLTMTITVTDVEKRMLDDLMAWRHPTDGRVVSLTLRECIRETWAREAEKRGQRAED